MSDELAVSITVDFWDVGHGDASVIRLDDSRIVVIDCGRRNARVADWVATSGFEVVALILTHNDVDHTAGLYHFLDKAGRQVMSWAWLQDRPADELKTELTFLQAGIKDRRWPYPRRIDPAPSCPQNLLHEELIPEEQRDHVAGILRAVRLEAIYPPMIEGMLGQLRGPNWTSALLVLWVHNQACVAWPGDLPLRICHDELSKRGISPLFLVGPHHGAPDLSGIDVSNAISGIGHDNLWVSVAWRRDYQHPNEAYLTKTAATAACVRCSQLTPRCDDDLERFGKGLMPTHEWLNVYRPPSGPSCMGPMRVTFSKKGADVRYSDEHQRAIDSVDHPCCRP